jgi:hypothetical protein
VAAVHFAECYEKDTRASVRQHGSSAVRFARAQITESNTWALARVRDGANGAANLQNQNRQLGDKIHRRQPRTKELHPVARHRGSPTRYRRDQRSEARAHTTNGRFKKRLFELAGLFRQAASSSENVFGGVAKKTKRFVG